jgi:hypothetical protein
MARGPHPHLPEPMGQGRHKLCSKTNTSASAHLGISNREDTLRAKVRSTLRKNIQNEDQVRH